MPDLPTFEEALRRQREALADRYRANQELSEYVDELFGETDEPIANYAARRGE
jgi:hypothetical protein